MPCSGPCARRFSLATAVLLVVAHALPAETNINFLVGTKQLEADDWPLGDAQGFGGIQTTFGPESWPVQIAVDAIGAGKSEDSFRLDLPGGVDISGEELVQSSWELDVGVRKIWRHGRVHPFVGGGLALIGARQERVLDEAPPIVGLPGGVLVIGESGSTAGLWIDGGVFWRFGRHFNLGVDARYSAGEVTLNERKVQAGGFHLGLMLGFAFGKR